MFGTYSPPIIAQTGPDAAYLLFPTKTQTGTLPSGVAQTWTIDGSTEIWHVKNAAGTPEAALYGVVFHYATMHGPSANFVPTYNSTSKTWEGQLPAAATSYTAPFLNINSPLSGTYVGAVPASGTPTGTIYGFKADFKGLTAQATYSPFGFYYNEPGSAATFTDPGEAIAAFVLSATTAFWVDSIPAGRGGSAYYVNNINDNTAFWVDSGSTGSLGFYATGVDGGFRADFFTSYGFFAQGSIGTPSTQVDFSALYGGIGFQTDSVEEYDFLAMNNPTSQTYKIAGFVSRARPLASAGITNAPAYDLEPQYWTGTASAVYRLSMIGVMDSATGPLAHWSFQAGLGLTTGTGVGDSTQGAYLTGHEVAALTQAGDLYLKGTLNLNTAQTTVAGATSGTLVWAQTMQGSSQKYVSATFNALVNNSGSTQTITVTFPTAFTGVAVVRVDGGNLANITLGVSNTTLTLSIPTGTTSYSGVVSVVGY